MNELMKITDVSARYNVTTRSLRYYEKTGLLTSIRSDDYAYRMYDETAITRLKQILILRKLNINIKDIRRIFDKPGSETVLEVLGKKVDDIDDEIALLNELKEIVLEFIEHINKADFNKDSDVKLLYDKAKEIETQISIIDYDGKSSIANTSNEDVSAGERLLDVTVRLDDKRITTPLVVKTYKQNLTATRFIGKKYSNGGAAWDDWNEDIDNQLKSQLDINLKDLYEDGDSFIGLMCQRDGFEYWIGYFTPENTPVPEGFEYEDFPESVIGVCWLYGHHDEVFAVEPIAYEKLKEDGFDVNDLWWFERYHPIRSAEDKEGNIIIDICFFMNESNREETITAKKIVEDVINEALTGEYQKSALELITYLRANEMEIPHGELDTFIWEITFKGELVCYFELSMECWGVLSAQVPGSWINWPEGENNGVYDDVNVDEYIKEIAWANVRICENAKPDAEPCGGECSPGRYKRILGKEFENVCVSALGLFGTDADKYPDILQCMKKMIEARKNEVFMQGVRNHGIKELIKMRKNVIKNKMLTLHCQRNDNNRGKK